MSSNRHGQAPGDLFQGDQKNDGSPNPLYLATSQSEHSTLSRHGKPTLAEISASRGNAGNYDEHRPHQERDKRHDHRTHHHQQQSHTSPRYNTLGPENTVTLDRPDSQTWDRHAAGRTPIGSPGRVVASPSTSTATVTALTGTHEESPSKSSSSSEEKTQPAAKAMQARTIRLSLGASTDLPKEVRMIPAVNCPEKIVSLIGEFCN